MATEVISQAPVAISLVKSNTETIIAALGVLVTFLAVLVALFQEKIKALFSGSSVRVEIVPEKPDCHIIQMTDQSGNRSHDAFYIRIRVTQEEGFWQRPSAENVEVMINRVWWINEKGAKELSENFLPMPLVWSHFSPRRTSIKIPKGSFRHCDLGYIMIPPIKGADINPMMFLDTMVKPNLVEYEDYPYVLPMGKHEIELIITGDNIRQQTKKWVIDFTDTWKSEKFIRENLTITEVTK